jgi:hypothetical protein
MDFKDALLKVGEASLEVYNMIDPFFLYSHLSDYSRSTLEKKHKVKLYYNILKVVNFYEFLLLNGIIEGKSMIIERYNKVSSIVSNEEYLFFLETTIDTILQTDYLYDYMQSNLSRTTIYPYVEKVLPRDTIYYKKNRCEYVHLDPNCKELAKVKTIYKKILPKETKLKVCKKCENANITVQEGQEHHFLNLVDVLFNTDYNTTKITKSKKIK